MVRFPDMLFVGMYRPREWSRLATIIAAALAGDGAPLLNVVRPFINLTDVDGPQATSQAIWAVTCPDGPPLAEDLEENGDHSPFYY